MWRWLSHSVCDVAMADPVLTGNCTKLINYIPVGSTKCPGAGGGPARSPQVEMSITGALTMPAMQGMAMAHAREFLPGLRQPVGIGAQIQLQTTQLQALGQAALQANAEPERLPWLASATLSWIKCYASMNLPQSQSLLHSRGPFQF